MENNSGLKTARTKPQSIIFLIGNLPNLQQSLAQVQSSFAHSFSQSNINDALLMFSLSKSQMSPEHKFAFLTPESINVNLTSDIDLIRSNIKEIFSSREIEMSILDFLEKIQTELDIHPDKEYHNVVQIIVIHGELQLEGPIFHQLLTHKDVHFDIVYIPESEENNESVFSETQRNLNEEQKTKSYYFKLKTPNDLSKAVSLLTAHPQQRLQQNDIDSFMQRALSKRRK
ncbi:hypothetical protein SteCoe_23841 [Stentor coeruleus]|uniref:Uncharacterized protein n=1 Tax=Stentor coeruleus TaxID=5963 RepID=A0A1R2BIW5_9CILI|nr:hypothetical protein SteCoe_23841 [Stentor coeruleus]